MKPNEVDSNNEQQLLKTVYNYKITIKPTPHRRRAEYKVGDHVRISKYRYLFDTGYSPNWTYEIFTIRKVLYSTDPITYLLKDYQDDLVNGCFYSEELQHVKDPNFYLIEKVIRTNKNKAYVKWMGFGPEHNSWVPKSSVV